MAFFKWIGLTVLFLWVAAMLMMRFRPQTAQEISNKVETEQDAAARLKKTQADVEEAQRREAEAANERALKQPWTNMKLDKFSWSDSGFGLIMTASFTVANNNKFAVKDIEISCVTRGESGTLLS